MQKEQDRNFPAHDKGQIISFSLSLETCLVICLVAISRRELMASRGMAKAHHCFARCLVHCLLLNQVFSMGVPLSSILLFHQNWPM